MRELLKEQVSTLGTYRHHSTLAQEKVKGWAASRGKLRTSSVRQSLVDLDRVWWQLRRELDSYIDVSEEEVSAATSAFDVLEGYKECSNGFSGLQVAYDSAEAARKRSQDRLPVVWRDTSNSLGELASILEDSDAFNIFFDSQGCKSSLATQTLTQAQLAAGGMRLVLDRFDVAGLHRPDVTAFTDAVKRIQDSHDQAKEGACSAERSGAPRALMTIWAVLCGVAVVMRSSL